MMHAAIKARDSEKAAVFGASLQRVKVSVQKCHTTPVDTVVHSD